LIKIWDLSTSIYAFLVKCKITVAGYAELARCKDENPILETVDTLFLMFCFWKLMATGC